LFFFYAKRSPAQIAAGPPLKMLAFCDVGHRESRGVLARIQAELHGDPRGIPTAPINALNLHPVP
jgi:hypothetical protein